MPSATRWRRASPSASSQLVLGLDPDPAALWPIAAPDTRDGDRPGPRGRAAAAVLAHCRALIDATARGLRRGQAAARALRGARRRPAGRRWGRSPSTRASAGLLVIADGKRGDIDVTAGAYAASLFGGMRHAVRARRRARRGPGDGQPADGPRRDRAVPGGGARERRAGVLLLVRTSNPGAADVEDLELAGRGPVWERHRGARRRARQRGRRRERAQRRRRGRRRDRARAPARGRAS